MTTRNERLDALQQAVEEWADRMEERYNNQLTFLRSVLNGRTHSTSVQRQSEEQTSSLLETSISEFLEES